MSPSLDKLIEQAAQALREQLGENLYSCCLYGSAVRGNFVEGQSDINLLIVLGVSNAESHEKVTRAIGKQTVIDPFVLGRSGLARTAGMFASKFNSIKRNYRVIYGADPLSAITINAAQERFLCEQALRNLQLRLSYAFITRERSKAYRRFLLRSVTPIFVQLSEVLRLEGSAVPKEFEMRVPLFERQFGIRGRVLSELLALKSNPKGLPETTDESWHEKLFPVVEAVVNWIDGHWRGQ